MIHIQPVSEATEEIWHALQRLLPQLTTRRLPPRREDLARLIADSASTLLIARFPQADSPIGGLATLVLYRTPVGLHARLEDVIVDETLRGQGLGAALTEEVIRRARAAGADYLSLTSNPARAAANALYKKMGFKPWQTNIYRIDFA